MNLLAWCQLFLVCYCVDAGLQVYTCLSKGNRYRQARLNKKVCGIVAVMICGPPIVILADVTVVMLFHTCADIFYPQATADLPRTLYLIMYS